MEWSLDACDWTVVRGYMERYPDADLPVVIDEETTALMQETYVTTLGNNTFMNDDGTSRPITAPVGIKLGSDLRTLENDALQDFHRWAIVGEVAALRRYKKKEAKIRGMLHELENKQQALQQQLLVHDRQATIYTEKLALIARDQEWAIVNGYSSLAEEHEVVQESQKTLVALHEELFTLEAEVHHYAMQEIDGRPLWASIVIRQKSSLLLRPGP